MNVAVASTLPAYSIYQDRSLGREGGLLRKFIDDAVSAPPLDRGDEIFNRLSDALKRAERNDGTRINAAVFSHAIQFLDLLPREVPLPNVIVESDHEIGLDWDQSNRNVVSVTIDDTAMMGFSALFGREPLYGRLDLAEGLPDTLRFLLARIFPKRRRT